MKDLIEVGPGVWRAKPGVVAWTRAHIAFLEERAFDTPKLRARILAHQEEDRLHEMLIYFCRGSENPMHAHDGPESAYVIFGNLWIELADRPSIHLGKGEFIRIPAGIMHQPMPVTDTCIIETVLR